MSKDHRKYIEVRLARLGEERTHGATLADVPRLLAAYASPDEGVRAAALRESCPCHVSWEVYEQLRKPALRLRRDRSPVVRALANHLEEDARTLLSMEADVVRYAERDDELAERTKPSGKRANRSGRER